MWTLIAIGNHTSYNLWYAFEQILINYETVCWESQLVSANVLFPFSRLRIKKDDVHISVLTSGVDIKVIFAPAIVSSSPNDVNSVKNIFSTISK